MKVELGGFTKCRIKFCDNSDVVTLLTLNKGVGISNGTELDLSLMCPKGGFFLFQISHLGDYWQLLYRSRYACLMIDLLDHNTEEKTKV